MTHVAKLPGGGKGTSVSPGTCCESRGSRVFFSCAAKSRAIAIPVDLDSQVNNLFLKSHNIVQKTAMNWRLSARNAARRDSVLAASRDYRNIIERLQVMLGAERSDLLLPGLRRCPVIAEKSQGWPWGEKPVW